MPIFCFGCKCGEKKEDLFGDRAEADASPIVCECGEKMVRLVTFPRLNLNHWRPNPMEMNAEKEAIAAGAYE